jgi:iron(III) transport system ATP-binding protein
VTQLELEALTKVFERAGKVIDSIDLHIQGGEFLTLLGPSGCGKSTFLRIIAGLEEPTSGRVLLDGRDITYEPPNRRPMGFVFQNYALFPHLSVAKNVAFGLEVRHTAKAEVEKRIAVALDRVQLGGLGSARIDQLSGGQQQRVALARALAVSPQLLLLDEPLSNLDAKLRAETRTTLRELHDSGDSTTIFVTHDQAEAMAISDRIAVVHGGRVQQIARPEEIYTKPSNRFVADFIGRNNVLNVVVQSPCDDSVIIRFDNGAEVAVPSDQRAAGLELRPGARLCACVRAESVQLMAEGGMGMFRGVVSEVEFGGPTRSGLVRTDVGHLQVETSSLGVFPAKGETVGLSVTPQAIHLVETQ